MPVPAEQQFRLVHPCDVGVPIEHHKHWHCRYRDKGQRYSGIRWADGLEGLIVWSANERAPSQAWIAWARLWAEQENPAWLRVGTMH